MLPGRSGQDTGSDLRFGRVALHCLQSSSQRMDHFIGYCIDHIGRLYVPLSEGGVA